MRDSDAARAEQRAGKKYQETKESRQIAEDASVRSALEEKFAEKRWEAEENDRIADGLSTQAALDEKLAARKRIEIRPVAEYNEDDNAWKLITEGIWQWAVKGSTYHLPYQSAWNSTTQKPEELIEPVLKWIDENFNSYSPYQEVWEKIEDKPNGLHAIKEYYTSAKRVSPTQFQLVVDTQEEMLVHTVIHLGNIASDAVDLVGLGTGAIATAAASVSTGGASAILAAFFLEEATRTGISLASEVADTIQDIASYYNEGHVIVTMGPDSKKPVDVITWLVL